jgi:hypothetical protein
LLGGESDHLITGLAWPVKARFLQSLLPQAKPIRLPLCTASYYATMNFAASCYSR